MKYPNTFQEMAVSPSIYSKEELNRLISEQIKEIKVLSKAKPKQQHFVMKAKDDVLLITTYEPKNGKINTFFSYNYQYENEVEMKEQERKRKNDY